MQHDFDLYGLLAILLCIELVHLFPVTSHVMEKNKNVFSRKKEKKRTRKHSAAMA
jgi:hypothetical protein